MNMIEKVARALAGDYDWETCPNDHDRWMNDARATIEAMREPTPIMLASGWTAVNRVKAGAGIARLGPGAGLTDSYSAMIDAALQDKT